MASTIGVEEFSAITLSIPRYLLDSSENHSQVLRRADETVGCLLFF